MVKLVKNVECRRRMVTHWVTKQLAEVIRSQVVVLVYRREFVLVDLIQTLKVSVKFKLEAGG